MPQAPPCTFAVLLHLQGAYRRSGGARKIWVSKYIASQSIPVRTYSSLSKGSINRKYAEQCVVLDLLHPVVCSSDVSFSRSPAQAIDLDRTYHLRIHFLSLATGKPHRSSTCPAIISPIHKLANRGGAIGVQLTVGFRHVGILVEDFGPQWCEFWVIQWDTAAIKVVSVVNAQGFAS